MKTMQEKCAIGAIAVGLGLGAVELGKVTFNRAHDFALLQAGGMNPSGEVIDVASVEKHQRVGTMPGTPPKSIAVTTWNITDTTGRKLEFTRSVPGMFFGNSGMTNVDVGQRVAINTARLGFPGAWIVDKAELK